MASPSIVFVCHQSPDWPSLSEDHRRGLPVDPARYVPDHEIPGFPPRIDRLIGRWNARFRIDFFTVRAVIASLSRRNIAAARDRGDGHAFRYHEMASVADLAARQEVYVYFHDDDDFFSPELAALVEGCATRPDAIVTPLFRIGPEIFTFARAEATPDVVWGQRKPQHFRFQTNNYGIHGRHCTTLPALAALKDHVTASAYADRHGFRDEVLPAIVSATVKTPASASLLPTIFRSDEQMRLGFDLFLRGVASARLPEAYRWIGDPLQAIRRLVESVYRGDGYEAIADLLPH